MMGNHDFMSVFAPVAQNTASTLQILPSTVPIPWAVKRLMGAQIKSTLAAHKASKYLWPGISRRRCGEKCGTRLSRSSGIFALKRPIAVKKKSPSLYTVDRLGHYKEQSRICSLPRDALPPTMYYRL